MNAPDAPPCAPRQHLPRGEEFLFLPPWVQPYAYRIVDRLFAHRVIRRGPKPRPLPYGPELEPDCDVGAFMDRNAMAGVLVVHRGHVVLERYGLGLQAHDRWSTMSTVKSMTAMLVGAAVHDGAIKSIDESLTNYLPALAGSAYEGVSLRHVLTMSSGTRWVEDYADRTSHVNRYSKSLADRVPGGVLALMASLERAHPPGTTFLYNSGDTYLLGAALTKASACRSPTTCRRRSGSRPAWNATASIRWRARMARRSAAAAPAWCCAISAASGCSS